MYKNNLKKDFGFRIPATILSVILACEQSELPRVSRNIKSILLKRMYHPGSSDYFDINKAISVSIRNFCKVCEAKSFCDLHLKFKQ